MFKYFLKAMSAFGWPIWIGLVGGGVGIVAGFGGVLATGSIVGALIYIAFVLVFVFIFWKLMFRPMAEHERLMEIGMEADATVVSIAENGSSLQVGGSLPKAGMRIELDVHARDRAPFRATVNAFISMFEVANYQPGKTLRVKYDPQNPQRLTIAEGTPSTGMYGSSLRRG